MLDTIKNILSRVGIYRVGIIKIEECEIINQRILPEWAKSAILFCIPYRSTNEIPTDGFSEYARIYDYHNYAKNLYEKIIPTMKSETQHNFQGFCDHSPINEKIAIAKCGLGVIGRNSLFIDDIYGSFVFIGSIITDITHRNDPFPTKSCINCGLCINTCPSSAIIEKGIDKNKCLSALSQKKNRTQEENNALQSAHIVWGCDICQNVCPHNKNAKISPITYFKTTRVKHINKEFVENLNDEEFKKYAFSYKGKKIVLNNLELM